MKMVKPKLMRGSGRIVSISYPPVKGVEFEEGEAESVKANVERIVEREGWSFSQMVWMALSEYVERHGPGNPAQTLTRFMNGKQMYRAPTKEHCFLRGCPKLAVGYAFSNTPEKARRPFCENHLRDAVKAGWKKDE